MFPFTIIATHKYYYNMHLNENKLYGLFAFCSANKFEIF